jgi:hypothetical protein
MPQAYAKYGKDMAAEPPACPEVEVQDPEHNIRIPSLPPLYNAPPAQEQEQQGQEEEGAQPGDASVGVARLGPAGASKALGGWGTSSIARPGNLAGEGHRQQHLPGDLRRPTQGVLLPIEKLLHNSTKSTVLLFTRPPASLPGAVDAIAARMEQQRAASGVFWDPPGEQLEEGEDSGLGGQL